MEHKRFVVAFNTASEAVIKHEFVFGADALTVAILYCNNLGWEFDLGYYLNIKDDEKGTALAIFHEDLWYEAEAVISVLEV